MFILMLACSLTETITSMSPRTTLPRLDKSEAISPAVKAQVIRMEGAHAVGSDFITSGPYLTRVSSY